MWRTFVGTRATQATGWGGGGLSPDLDGPLLVTPAGLEEGAQGVWEQRSGDWTWEGGAVFTGETPNGEGLERQAAQSSDFLWTWEAMAGLRPRRNLIRFGLWKGLRGQLLRAGYVGGWGQERGGSWQGGGFWYLERTEAHGVRGWWEGWSSLGIGRLSRAVWPGPTQFPFWASLPVSSRWGKFPEAPASGGGCCRVTPPPPACFLAPGQSTCFTPQTPCALQGTGPPRFTRVYRAEPSPDTGLPMQALRYPEARMETAELWETQGTVAGGPLRSGCPRKGGLAVGGSREPRPL